MLSNAPYMLNLDCDHYINTSTALREAMCFMMDPNVGKKACYVQFPQRFDGIDPSDRYANHNTVFFDVSRGQRRDRAGDRWGEGKGIVREAQRWWGVGASCKLWENMAISFFPGASRRPWCVHG